MKRFLRSLPAWILLAFFAIGLIVRLTVKDTVPLLAALYYATPIMVLAVAAALSGLCWKLLGNPRKALLSLLATVLSVAWWSYASHFNNAGSHADADTGVVFWNVQGGRLGWSGIIDTLARYDSDIMGVVEVGGTDAASHRRWQEAFPQHEVTDTEGGMLLICSGRITEVTSGPLGKGGRYKHARLETSQGVLHILIVDINSDPLMLRREPIAEIAAITSKIGNAPTLVMGDFNTPGDSVHFEILRRTFVNAFESHGQGYSATWPIPLPVLQLDHIWANPAVRISECKTGWTWRSDHRPIIAWITISTPVPANPITVEGSGR